MSKNIYGNIAITVLLLAVLVFGWAIVKSNDLKRMRAEKVSEQLEKIEERIGSIERKLQKISSTPRTVILKSGSNEEKPAQEIANLKFYSPEAQFGGRKIFATASETKNMNYLINNESLVSTLWNYCNSSVAERNYENLEVFQPMLAETWSISEDKLTYTIKLRKGILWQDFKDPVSGKEWKNVKLTSHDFKFYIDVIKDKETDCAPMRAYLINLDRIEVVNDHEFKVIWKKKYFNSKPITLSLTPLPRHLYHAYKGKFDGKKFNNDHERNRLIVGCGPYKFAGWNKGQTIKLTKSENFFGKGYGIEPPINDLVYDVIKHQTTQLQALEAQDIDIMQFTPEQWVKRTHTEAFDKEKGYIKKIKYPGRSYRYIGYNQKSPLFKDKRVRQALTHLVNRKRIIKDVYHGLARIITGNFFIETPYYDKSIKPYPFSVEKALKLFAESGWKDSDGDGILDKEGKKFEFTMLSTLANPNYGKILPMVKEDMAKAGVIMRIKNADWAVFYQALKRKEYEAAICGWGLGLLSEPRQLWHSSYADVLESSNHVGFKNKRADEIIEQLEICFDMKERIKLAHEFHKIIHEEQPYTFLFSGESLMGINRRYQNVRIFPTGPAGKIMWTPKRQQKTITP